MSGYQQLRRVAPDARPAWVRERFPGGASPQWWQAVLEEAELDVSSLRSLPHDRYRENAAVAVSLVELAEADGGVDACRAARWLLRLAAMALRVDPPVRDLPDAVTPDGAARLALDRLGPPERALDLAARVRADSAAGSDMWHRPGQPVPAPDRDAVRLAGIRDLVASLASVVDRIGDDRLRADTMRWLDLLPGLAPA